MSKPYKKIALKMRVGSTHFFKTQNEARILQDALYRMGRLGSRYQRKGGYGVRRIY